MKVQSKAAFSTTRPTFSSGALPEWGNAKSPVTPQTYKQPVCAQAIALTKEANMGWAAGSMQGRQTALAACKAAADAADTCHKELVNMFKLNT